MDDPDDDNSDDLQTSSSIPNDIVVDPTVALCCPKCKKIFKYAGRLELHKKKPPSSCLKAQVVLARQAGSQSDPHRLSATNEPIHIRLQNFRKSTFVPDHVPKAVRKTVAARLMEILRAVVDNNSIEAWTVFLTFTYSFLGQSKSSPLNRRALPATIRSNLRGEVQPTSTWTPSTTESKDKADQTSKDKAMVKRVYRKIQEGDVPGAVRQLISEETVLSPTQEVLAALREKHPPGHVDELPHEGEETPAPSQLSADEVYRALRGFPKGSAAGPDGMKPQHLKELLGALSGTDHTSFLELLAGVGNIMLKGEVPESVRDTLYGANLFAFKKKDGGIRPIAVGIALRRLVGRAVSRRLQHLQEKLAPDQLGFSVKGGMEAAIHAVRDFAEREETSQRVKALLKLDVKNAFNSLDRRYMLQVVRSEIPEYYRLLRQSYGSPSFLLTGEEVILSRSGVQQGDPLGPLLFCLATHPLHEGLQAEVQVSYLDDDVLCGTPSELLEDFATLSQRYQQAGLEFNLAKSEIFLVGGREHERATKTRLIKAQHPDLIWTSAKNLTYLGSPLLASGVPPKLTELTSKAKLFDERLRLLNCHTAMYLIMNSLGPVRTIHLLRTSRAYDHPDALELYDDAIQASLTRFSNNDITEAAGLQASLPYDKGGMGVRRTVKLALPAFLASAHAVQNLAAQILPFEVAGYAHDALQRWKEVTGKTFPTSPASAVQETWDTPVVDVLVKELNDMQADDPTHLARLKAVSTRDSSAWLRSAPIAPVGALLDDNTIRNAVGQRLGLNVCAPHTCRCGEPADSLGHHALSCKRSAGRIPRHTRLNDVISRALQSAGFPNELEPQGLSAFDGRRPDGLTIVPFSGGKSATWDVTVTDTLAISNIAKSTALAGSAAASAEVTKREKYRDLSPNYVFLPLAFETLGPFGPQATALVEKIGNILKFKTKEPRAAEFLKQRISLEIQRGNAQCVLGTRPEGPNLDEAFQF